MLCLRFGKWEPLQNHVWVFLKCSHYSLNTSWHVGTKSCSRLSRYFLCPTLKSIVVHRAWYLFMDLFFRNPEPGAKYARCYWISLSSDSFFSPIFWQPASPGNKIFWLRAGTEGYLLGRIGVQDTWGSCTQSSTISSQHLDPALCGPWYLQALSSLKEKTQYLLYQYPSLLSHLHSLSVLLKFVESLSWFSVLLWVYNFFLLMREGELE